MEYPNGIGTAIEVHRRSATLDIFKRR
jgi:hypothetical protein